ncbi:MAG: hypothetical protein Q8M92_01375 [Candidatus Subteraquimicrobiales bacterium]|nr:hypothetical protein [Candidatus Subteraquimicrobiales bacterium]
MDEKEKQKIIDELMQDKEAEDVIKLAFIMQGYETEKKTIHEKTNEGEQR